MILPEQAARLTDISERQIKTPIQEGKLFE
jgi:hypothetical protein